MGAMEVTLFHSFEGGFATPGPSESEGIGAVLLAMMRLLCGPVSSNILWIAFDGQTRISAPSDESNEVPRQNSHPTETDEGSMESTVVVFGL